MWGIFSDIESAVHMHMGNYGIDYERVVGKWEYPGGYVGGAPLVIDGNPVMATIERVAEALGVEVDAILTNDFDELSKWRHKFPFVKDRYRVEKAYEDTIFQPETVEEKIIRVVFQYDDERPGAPRPLRYSTESIKVRLNALLRAYDHQLPGTYHYGATIEKLTIGIANIFHDSAMIPIFKSYIDMFERLEYLFFRALWNGLEKDEQCEYNFLVSVFELHDRLVHMEQNLYYSELEKRRNAYLAENSDYIFDYVDVAPDCFFQPYRCAEFLEETNLVQTYLLLHPQMKRSMRQHAMKIDAFRCEYVWSDAPVVEGKKVVEVAYLPKSSEEMGDTQIYAELMKKYSASEAKGGLPVRRQKPLCREDIPLIAARLGLKGAGDV